MAAAEIGEFARLQRNCQSQRTLLQGADADEVESFSLTIRPDTTRPGEVVASGSDLYGWWRVPWGKETTAEVQSVQNVRGRKAIRLQNIDGPSSLQFGLVHKATLKAGKIYRVEFEYLSPSSASAAIVMEGKREDLLQAEDWKVKTWWLEIDPPRSKLRHGAARYGKRTSKCTLLASSGRASG